jgi:hypothetical protein
VSGASEPDGPQLETAIEEAMAAVIETGPLSDLRLSFDDRASPWHTVCEIDAASRPRLLADVAAVFRAAGVTVRAAAITSHDGRAYDTFELTTLDGRKLDPETQDLVRLLADRGVVGRNRRFRAPALVAR